MFLGFAYCVFSEILLISISSLKNDKFPKVKYIILSLTLFLISNVFAQDSFILNYEDVDIRKVTQDIAQFSKKTIILDPRVKGKITIYSNANLNRNQVWNVYLRTIQVNGFSACLLYTSPSPRDRG